VAGGVRGWQVKAQLFLYITKNDFLGGFMLSAATTCHHLPPSAPLRLLPLYTTQIFLIIIIIDDIHI
jgi:hypothetical protein